MRQGFSITVPAVVTVNTHGHSSVTFRLQVKDNGTLALRVKEYIAPLSPDAIAHPAPAAWHWNISPASLVIRPGRTRYVTVHVTGMHSGTVVVDDVVFVAQPADPSRAQASVAGAVATKVTITPGKATGLAVAAHPLAAHPQASTDVPGLLGVITLAAAAGLAGLAALILRVRRRRKKPAAHATGKAPVALVPVQRVRHPGDDYLS